MPQFAQSVLMATPLETFLSANNLVIPRHVMLILPPFCPSDISKSFQALIVWGATPPQGSWSVGPQLSVVS